MTHANVSPAPYSLMPTCGEATEADDAPPTDAPAPEHEYVVEFRVSDIT